MDYMGHMGQGNKFTWDQVRGRRAFVMRQLSNLFFGGGVGHGVQAVGSSKFTFRG